MKAYKITIEEKEQLINTQMEDGMWFNPVQDINEDWFIFEVEHNCSEIGIEVEFVAPVVEEEIEI